MLVAMFPMIVHADDENPYDIGTWAYLQYELDHSNGPVELDRDYVAGEGDTCLTVSRNVTLFLNGHIIDRGLRTKEASPTGHVIKIVAGGTLAMPYVGGDPGLITGGNALHGGGILVEAGGKLMFQHGQIAGNQVVYSASDEDSGCGSGVFVAVGGEMQVTTFTGIVGMITGNSGGLYGGGIYLAGMLSVSGGMITSNRVIDGGKGKDIYVASSGELSISGAPSVDDIYLSGTRKINISSDLSGSARIGVSTEAELPAAVTNGYTSYKPAGYEASTMFSSPQGDIDTSEGGEVTITDGGGHQTIEPVKIKTCNVTVGGTLGVNVYVDYGSLDAATIESSSVVISISGKGGGEKTYTFEDAVARDFDGTTCYGYTFDISSIQMADRISVIVKCEGQENVTADFSVEDYLTALDRNWQELGYEYNDSLIARMVANYGYFIQRYLDNINDGWSVANGDHKEFTTKYSPMDPISSRIYEMAMEGTEDTDRVKYSPTKVVDENSTIKKLTYSLEFGTTIALEVFFTVEPGTDFSASAYCAHTGKTYRAYLADDGRYKIRVSGISVQELGDMFISITGTAGSDFTVDVHPFGYIYNAVNSSSTTEKAQLKKDAMTALYLFWYQLQPSI